MDAAFLLGQKLTIKFWHRKNCDNRVDQDCLFKSIRSRIALFAIQYFLQDCKVLRDNYTSWSAYL